MNITLDSLLTHLEAMLLSLQYKTNPYGSFILERKRKQIFANKCNYQIGFSILCVQALKLCYLIGRWPGFPTFLPGGRGFLLLLGWRCVVVKVHSSVTSADFLVQPLQFLLCATQTTVTGITNSTSNLIDPLHTLDLLRT